MENKFLGLLSKDLLVKTSCLSAQRRSSFLLLIFNLMASEPQNWLPDDDDFISTLIGLPVDEWQEIKLFAIKIKLIMETKNEKNNLEKPNGLFSPDLQKIIASDDGRRRASRQNGKKGGRPKNLEKPVGLLKVEKALQSQGFQGGVQKNNLEKPNGFSDPPTSLEPPGFECDLEKNNPLGFSRLLDQGERLVSQEVSGKPRKSELQSCKDLNNVGRIIINNNNINTRDSSTRDHGDNNSVLFTPKTFGFESCHESKISKKRKFSFDEPHLKIAKDFFEKIKIIVPCAKEPSFDAWANEIRMLEQLDGRELSDIEAMFDFATKHEFWCKNILSPQKLRKHWEKLWVEKNKGGVYNRHGVQKGLQGRAIVPAEERQSGEFRF